MFCSVPTTRCQTMRLHGSRLQLAPKQRPSSSSESAIQRTAPPLHSDLPEPASTRAPRGQLTSTITSRTARRDRNAEKCPCRSHYPTWLVLRRCSHGTGASTGAEAPEEQPKRRPPHCRWQSWATEPDAEYIQFLEPVVWRQKRTKGPMGTFVVRHSQSRRGGLLFLNHVHEPPRTRRETADGCLV